MTSDLNEVIRLLELKVALLQQEISELRTQNQSYADELSNLQHSERLAAISRAVLIREREESQRDLKRVSEDLSAAERSLLEIEVERDRLARNLEATRESLRRITNSRWHQLGVHLRPIRRKPWLLLPFGFKILVHLQREIRTTRGSTTGPSMPRKALMSARKRDRRDNSDLPAIRASLQTIRKPDTPAFDTVVKSIFDEFTESCLQDQVHLVPLSVKDEENEIRSSDMVMVETAWNGNNGEWKWMISQSARLETLAKKTQVARDLGIPTVFWNKEDPPHYERFLPAARLFDFVFTTASECVPKYEAALGHKNVAPLMFAANPFLHNPIGRIENPRTPICFAGAIRGNNYPERARWLEETIAILGTNGGIDLYLRDPSETISPILSQHVRGSLPYDDMVCAYRNYPIFLNVNSVSDSQTMISRRVFELLGCGTVVVSSPSPALTRLFPEIVLQAATPDEALSHVQELTANNEYAHRLAARGVRAVHANHTYRDRMSQLLATVGKKFEMVDATIAVVAVTHRPDDLDNLISNITSQTLTPDEVHFVLHGNSWATEHENMIALRIPNSKIYHLPEAGTLGDGLNLAISSATTTWCAKFDSDDFYGPNYLLDMRICANFSGADVLGKKSYFMHFEASSQTYLRQPENEHKFTNRVAGATLFFRRDIAVQIGFRSLVSGTDTDFLAACRRRGHTIYSGDRYEFLARRSATGEHTWARTDDDLIKNSTYFPNITGTGDVCL